MKIEYREVPAETIVTHFVKDYKVKVAEHEWFFDAKKGVFILKLYIEKPAADA